MENEFDLTKNLSLLKEMTDKNFDWDAYFTNPDAVYMMSVWSNCFRVLDMNEKKDRDWIECGSFAATETPKALYRLLWLCKPPAVDFSDMYKDMLFAICTPDEKFMITIELFKFQVGLYFFAPRATIKGNGRGIIAGWPGANNGYYCSDPVGKLFFEVVSKLTEYTHMVYGGNNFEV